MSARTRQSGCEDTPAQGEHRADALFALPTIPRTAALFGALPGWVGDLTARRIDVLKHDARIRPDLAVATTEFADRALSSGAESVIVDGSRSAVRAIAEAGLSTRRLLPIPIHGSPIIYLDLGHRRAARYAIEQEVVHPERWRTARNRVAASLAWIGALPAASVVAVGSRTSGAPALIAAAASLGAPADAAWFMTVSPGVVSRRNAFLLFPGGAARPEYAVKFARIRGLREPFARDERAAAVVAAAGAQVAEQVPRYLGEFEVDGYHASLETAAVGMRLGSVLRGPGPLVEKIAALDTIAGWLIAVAEATACPPEAVEPERARLIREVMPLWRSAGASADLVTSLPPVPGCFQHNDMGDENVLVRRGGFSVLDWEWARPHCLPLGDLLFFSAHTLRILDGADLEVDRGRYFVELMTGQAPSARLLFGWIGAIVKALSLPLGSVGQLATLGWLSRGALSAQERRWAEAVGGTALGESFAERAARLWLSQPGLGPGWDAWRR
jgi:hypothetical protein